jgi:hypothetical protein
MKMYREWTYRSLELNICCPILVSLRNTCNFIHFCVNTFYNFWTCLCLTNLWQRTAAAAYMLSWLLWTFIFRIYNPNSAVARPYSVAESCNISEQSVFTKGILTSNSQAWTKDIPLWILTGWFEQLSNYRSIYLSTYGSTALCWTLAVFHFLNPRTPSVGLLGRGISQSQGRYLHTE